MKKIAFAAFASAAVLALAACEPAPEPTETGSVETTPGDMMTGDATDAPTDAATAAM